MTQENIQLMIPFQVIVDFVSGLSLKDKRRLWVLLDEEIAQTEEATWEQDTTFQAEIQEARIAYQAGDYVTIDEYKTQQPKND